jgi:hypothetical protein
LPWLRRVDLGEGFVEFESFEGSFGVKAFEEVSALR